MKNKSNRKTYIVLSAALVLLTAVTFFLPRMLWGMYDRKLSSDEIPLDMSVSTYDVREISLEERLKRIQEELENGVLPTNILMYETGETTEGELCGYVNDELELLAEAGIFRYRDCFQLDEEHLVKYDKYNMIAGYSTQLWKLSWEGGKNAETYWEMEIILDCDTHKILLMQYSRECEDSDNLVETVLDIREMADGWCAYLGLGKGKAIAGYDSGETSASVASDGAEATDWYEFYEEKSGLRAQIYDVVTQNDGIYGFLGFNVMKDIL